MSLKSRDGPVGNDMLNESNLLPPSSYHRFGSVSDWVEESYQLMIKGCIEFGLMQQGAAANSDLQKPATKDEAETVEKKSEESTPDSWPMTLKRKKGNGSSNYTIEVDTRVPIEFRCNTEGSKCVDGMNYKLPKQIFAGKHFFLMDTETGLLGHGLAFGNEWTVKLHGGHVVHDVHEIKTDTILVETFDAGVNNKFRMRYPSLRVMSPHDIMEEAKTAKMNQEIKDILDWCKPYDFENGNCTSNLPGPGDELDEDSQQLVINVGNDDEKEEELISNASVEGSSPKRSKLDESKTSSDDDNDEIEKTAVQQNDQTPKSELIPKETRHIPSYDRYLGIWKTVIGIFFRLAHQYARKSCLARAAVKEYDRVYGKRLSERVVLGWLNQFDDVSATFESFKVDLGLSKRHRDAMINLLGFDKKPDAYSSDSD